MMIQQQ